MNADDKREALARVLYGNGVDLPLYDPIDIDFKDVAGVIIANRDAVLRELGGRRGTSGQWLVPASPEEEVPDE